MPRPLANFPTWRSDIYLHPWFSTNLQLHPWSTLTYSFIPRSTLTFSSTTGFTMTFISISDFTLIFSSVCLQLLWISPSYFLKRMGKQDFYPTGFDSWQSFTNTLQVQCHKVHSLFIHNALYMIYTVGQQESMLNVSPELATIQLDF